MQTYLVHTRSPRRLNAELGLGAALGFHALMGGIVLSALVHPLFYVLLAYHALSGDLLAPSETVAGSVFWAIAWSNLGASYAIAILAGASSVCRRRRPRLLLSVLFVPVTWLLISVAAYRAALQRARDPFLWEKTEHGGGRARR
jgi:glycosyltransferase XagB